MTVVLSTRSGFSQPSPESIRFGSRFSNKCGRLGGPLGPGRRKERLKPSFVRMLFQQEGSLRMAPISSVVRDSMDGAHQDA